MRPDLFWSVQVLNIPDLLSQPLTAQVFIVQG